RASVTLLPLLFLSSPHAALPDRHSFPTRRSSDLLGGVTRRVTSPPLDRLGRRDALAPLAWPAALRRREVEAFRAQPRALHGQTPDRKSTRLNSSHVKISYAVFCLKKKNKDNKHES